MNHMDENNAAFPYGEYVTWHLPEDLPTVPASPLRDWLLNTGSLTKKLRTCCETFEVKVLQQTKTQDKNADDHGNFWIREVLLCLDGIPWVFARTLIPNGLMLLPDNELKNLGNRPLGELLFNNKEYQAEMLKIACFHSCPKLASFAQSLSQFSTEPLWGRKRYFYRQQYKLIVSEIFLPSAIERIMALKGS